MNADLTDRIVTAAISDAVATHRAQDWHPDWPVTTIIENLIVTMGDLDLACIADLACLVILTHPAEATRHARLLNNVL